MTARAVLTPVNLAGPEGLILPAAGVQTLTGFTGVEFQGTQYTFAVFYITTTGTTITQQIGGRIQGQTPPGITAVLASSTNYLFGPWPDKDFTQLDGTGYTYIDWSGTPTGTVTLYQCIPAP
jgi:hypothetical protein